jgi:superfamily II RNA helicase
MAVNILKGKCEDYSSKTVFTIGYELDDFQKHSIMAIDRGEHVLVTAHTGSGKTVIAEYAIAKALEERKKVIYCSPIKTLSNQKYNEFRAIFENEIISVGLMTGDNKIKPDANLVIMTTEVLRNALYGINKEGGEVDYLQIDNNLGTVIFDEIHYINDRDRGKVWEETLNLLASNVNLVMLSATIDNSFEFATWIASLNNHTVNLVSTEKRVIPLNHNIFLDNKLIPILDNDDKFDEIQYDAALKKYNKLLINNKLNGKYQINSLVSYLKENNLFQTIFFCFSRRLCEKFANDIEASLITPQERSEIEDIFNKHMKKYESMYISLNQYNEIKRMLNKGICYHHSGVIPIFKEIIEIIFQKGLIKILFATETFAVGVNMPTKTVVFTDLKKHTETGLRNLLTCEYKQMSGRAGRRGLDDTGTIIILPLYNLYSKMDIKQIMTGKLPHIESQFYLDYNIILKILQSVSITDNVNELVKEFLRKTLYVKNVNTKLITYDLDCEKVKSKIVDENISADVQTMYNSYMEYDKYDQDMKSMGIRCKPNKKRINDKKQLITKMKNMGIFDGLEKYKRYLENSHNYEKLLTEKFCIQNSMEIECDKMLKVLQKFKYIGLDNKILPKGIIASQINDCNSMILTELIVENMFDNLTPIEIVGVIAIFVGEGDDEFTSIKNDQVINTVNRINYIIDDYINFEESLEVSVKINNFWKVNTTFVNTALSWASQQTLANTIDGEMYIGNFIKNILKISKIIKDMTFLYTLYGNLTIIPKLASIEQILIRDVVTINSLYL